MFELPDLPYEKDALQPVISPETLDFHHGKHHAKYVETLNGLLKEKDAPAGPLEEIVRWAAERSEQKLFNNAAQAWNHTFFWTCMTDERQQPEGELAQAIGRDFGDLAGLKQAFVAEGVGHFASGWVWLAAEGATLKVVSTHDADDLLTHRGLVPLLVCDLWEHAYYLDHQNDRKGFLEDWFDRLPNWSFAARQYAAARGEGDVWKHPPPRAG